jgi:orotidine-5'-phosphate decarboxylase
VGFLTKLKKKWDQGKFVCVGLDSADFTLNKKVVDDTFELVCAYKPNAAFYKEAQLQKTVSYIKENYPDIPIILDAKRGDIGPYNKGYVNSTFDIMGFDAITLHPYLGKESLKPFLDRRDKVCIIVCHTSNPGAGELQDFIVEGVPLWQRVAQKVVSEWNENKNCMLVVGATYPEEMKKIRNLTGDITFLVPGIGAQGGDLEAVMKAGLNSEHLGLIINSSRGIIFADNPKEEARKLCEEIRKYKSI